MAIKSINDLVEAGAMTAAKAQGLDDVAASFAVSITPHLMQQIGAEGGDGPIARQYVPDSAEAVVGDDEDGDPIGDRAHEKEAGLIHRYDDRVLILVSSVCAAYCRFCFRREKTGPPNRNMGKDDIDRAIGYVRDHDEIWEVILSGGDPLMLSSKRLAAIAEQIRDIDHVGILRIHTRMPLVKPEAVDDRLLQALTIKEPTYLVLHVNHPSELTQDVRGAIKRLADAGIALLSQSVLLRGINDDAAVLRSLFRNLVQLRVKPYYLHALDRARGTAHFAVPIEEGQEIMRALRQTASGLCQPQFMLDIPGGYGKVPVGPQFAERHGQSYTVTDIHGAAHAYRDPAGRRDDTAKRSEPGT